MMKKMLLIVFGGLLAIMAGGSIVAVGVYALFTSFYGFGAVEMRSFGFFFVMGAAATGFGGAMYMMYQAETA